MSPVAPSTIRAALIGEEIADFDSEYRRALSDAAEKLDLTALVDMLQRWQRIALSSRDETAHRHMLEHADKLDAGDEVETHPWGKVKARWGL